MAKKDRRSLLLVDDEEDLCSTLAEQVRSVLGYDVFCAGNGRAALEVIKSTDIDAVLCDIFMPEMNGIELLSEMRARGNDLPFIFLTGYQSDENILKALRLGAVDFLQKPFQQQELFEAVERVLDIGSRRATIKETLQTLKEAHPTSVRKIEILERNQEQIGRLQAIGTVRKRSK